MRTEELILEILELILSNKHRKPFATMTANGSDAVLVKVFPERADYIDDGKPMFRQYIQFDGLDIGDGTPEECASRTFEFLNDLYS